MFAFFGLRPVYFCVGLFASPLVAIDRQFYVIVAHSGHLLYHLLCKFILAVGAIVSSTAGAQFASILLRSDILYTLEGNCLMQVLIVYHSLHLQLDDETML